MADLGQFSLILALFLSSYAILADIAGAWCLDSGLLRSGRNAMVCCLLCLSVAMTILWIQLIRCDFSVRYVAEHTSLDLLLSYRISALWAGAAGSLLLWLWLQTGMLITVFFSTQSAKRSFCAHARVIANLVAVFFLLVLVLDKDPFTLSEVIPRDGAGLNPLLQHPAMVLHPPLLLVGYAAFAVPFAWAFACFKSNTEVREPPFVRAARNWALTAWIFLTVGIVLGAWWAYEELGWGGYWAWDPVENSSLMPWLVATAMLHSFRIFTPKTRIVIWTEILCLLTFSLCIFGTFLTRYGLVSSVHAFPDPGKGILFVILLIHIWVLSGFLIVKRFWRRKDQPSFSHPRAQEIFVWNNWLFLLLTFVIFVGTLFPFLSGLVSKRQITLKPEYFTKITSPGGLVLVLFIGLCPYLWQHGFKKSVRFILAGLVIVICAILWFMFKQLAPLFFVVSGLLLLNLVMDIIILARTGKINWRAYGARIVHLGVALIFIGIAGSGGYDVERQISMMPGQQEQLGGYNLVYESLGADHGPNFTAMWAAVSVYDQSDKLVAQLKPAKAVYSAGGKAVSEVDIRRTLGSDVYLALMDVDIASKMINLRAMVKPLINWIWIGSTLMVMGAGIVILNLVVSRK
ncbi:MAG: cytochrome c biogenesis protein CcsA [Phycisphaerae bacterium]|nr:cytochrome c biogenesis protein CcsA [Phycisphaerae bacterium]